MSKLGLFILAMVASFAAHASPSEPSSPTISCAYDFAKANIGFIKEKNLSNALQTPRRLVRLADQQCESVRPAGEAPGTGTLFGVQKAVSEVFDVPRLLQTMPIKDLVYQLDRQFKWEHVIAIGWLVMPISIDFFHADKQDISFNGETHHYEVGAWTSSQTFGSTRIEHFVYRDVDSGQVLTSMKSHGLPGTRDESQEIRPLEFSDFHFWFD